MPARREARAPRRGWAPPRAAAALGYGAGEAWTAFRRNGLMSLAAVLTIMVTLLLVGAAAAVAANLRLMASTLEGQVEVIAYLREGLAPAEIDRTMGAVRTLPGVRTVALVGREEALGRLQALFGDRVSLRDMIQTNPLPDSLEIALTNAGRAREVAAAVEQMAAVEEVTSGGQVLDRLLAATLLLRGGGAGAAALLGAVALVIIMNTIRLTILGRRQEIDIMQLVGAGGWYVRAPFVLEGALQGALATVLAGVLLVPGYLLVRGRLEMLLPFLPTVHPDALLPALVAALGAGGVLVGMSGSSLALRRFLHV
ncbi:MAG: permease-like cell division protein FtsX [bacterium]